MTSKEKRYWDSWEAHTGVRKMTREGFWEWFKKNYNSNKGMFEHWDGVLMFDFIRGHAERLKVQNMNGLFQDAGLYVHRFVQIEDLEQGIDIVDEILTNIRAGKMPNSHEWSRRILNPKLRKPVKETPTPVSRFKDLAKYPKQVHDKYYQDHVTLTGLQMWQDFLDMDEKELTKEVISLYREFDKGKLNDIQEDISERFIEENDFINDIKSRWSNDYSGTVIHEGKVSELTLHQKLMPIFVKRNIGFIDLSDAGAGKSDSALHTISQINTKFNLIVAPAGIINNCQWENYIKNAFKNASIYKNKDVFTKNFKKNISKDKKNKRRVFYLLSYNFISRESGSVILSRLKRQGVDFICIDEGQRTKVRDDVKMSKCRTKLESMISDIRSVKPRTKVLMLTATPVPNTVSEGKSLLTLVTGTKKGYNKITSYNSLQNMAKMHSALQLHSLRYKKMFKNKSGNIIKINKETIPVKANYRLREHSKKLNNVGFLGMEQIALEAKLPRMLKELKQRKHKVIIFTKFVTGIVDRIAEICHDNKISCTYYTGSDKSGLTGRQEFYNGAQVLIASSAISEGIDRLQDYCSELWFVGQGWTYTEREQTIGRIYRTGQTKPVSVLTFEAEINGVKYDKLVKSNRIGYKGIIHKMITNGEMPDDISPPEYTMKNIIGEMTKEQTSSKGKELPSKTIKRLSDMASKSLKAKAMRKQRKKHGKKKK
tara:strand:+ start:1142 stop:3274 length:2133 start_codon:yes stop_codon:yes gene_type:complete